ncbi:hypothetical protein [Maridesulfovibrio sp.]|uniref:hypothetical protein n=1 Tax=Maridesulfovibrio sp. TaxID=2795000 RepID=UPI002A18C0E0|nr:hypothetical protein [Maridesulfovibrio sp.]
MSEIKINGLNYDWPSVSVTGPNGVFIDITEVNWKSSQKKKRIYGKGSVPTGVARGNYSATVDFTISKDEYRQFVESLGTSPFKAEFDLAIVFELDGQDRSETLIKQVLIDDVDDSAKQGEDAIVVKLSGTAQMIIKDGVPDYE